MKLYLHIDLNQFFVACERLRDSALVGKPVVIGVYSGRNDHSGAVATASYEARALGINSGMPLNTAYAIAKKAEEHGEKIIFLKTDFELYDRVSSELFSEVRKLGKFDQFSIDEGFLELEVQDKEQALRIAESMNSLVESKGFKCAIGISDSMVTAKIASGQKKGILFVDEPLSFLEPLGIREMLGVGKKTEEVLKLHGVNTIGELRKLDIAKLDGLFGKEFGGYLFRAARNLEKAYYTEKAENQVSRIVTMKKDSDSYDELEPLVFGLVEEVTNNLKEKKKSAKGIQINGVTNSLKTLSKRKSLPRNTDEKDYIIRETRKLLIEFCQHLQEEGLVLRRIGFAVFDLAEADRQTKLF